MNNALLERSVCIPAIPSYMPAYQDSMIANLPSDEWRCDARTAKMVASLFASVFAASASVAMPALGAQTTVGQVWVANSSTLVSFDRQAVLQPSIELSAEEHAVLRQAIWDSAEIVAKGRFVEEL